MIYMCIWDAHIYIYINTYLYGMHIYICMLLKTTVTPLVVALRASSFLQGIFAPLPGAAASPDREALGRIWDEKNMVPSGYDSHSHGESPINGGFNGKTIYKWAIVHGYVK